MKSPYEKRYTAKLGMDLHLHTTRSFRHEFKGQVTCKQLSSHHSLYNCYLMPVEDSGLYQAVGIAMWCFFTCFHISRFRSCHRIRESIRRTYLQHFRGQNFYRQSHDLFTEVRFRVLITIISKQALTIILNDSLQVVSH